MAYKYRCLVLNCKTPRRSLRQLNETRRRIKKFYNYRSQSAATASYGNLGTLFRSLGQYDKAREYQEKALAIRIEIGDRDGEATSYGNLGTLFQSLGQYDKAREYQEK